MDFTTFDIGSDKKEQKNKDLNIDINIKDQQLRSSNLNIGSSNSNIDSPTKKFRIAVAMSGGIDSSTVAALLHEQGHEVIGITLQLYDYGALAKKGACCAGQDIYDAKEASEHIGIPHYVLNYESKFKEKVIDNFIETYLQGETPLPCVMCNMSVKFTDLIKAAKELGMDFLATGHYVRKVDETLYKSSITNLTANTETYINTGTNTDTNIGTDTDTGTNTDTNIGTDTDTSIATITSIGKYQNNQELQQENVNLSYTNSQNKNNKYTKSELHKAIDNTKDQSYFLFNTTQEQLNYLLFPLGSMTKTQTREHAKRLGIRIHNKPDSQDICFVPNGNYIEVIEKYRPDALKEGEIFHIDGFVIGKHLGIHNYTIGQRKGIGIAYEYPLYVIKLDAINNIVYVGPESALHKTVFYIKEVNLLEDIIKDKEYTVKIRSQHPGCLAILTSLANNCIKVELLEKQRAISPGQACVIYDGTRVIGGGWIYLLN